MLFTAEVNQRKNIGFETQVKSKIRNLDEDMNRIRKTIPKMIFYFASMLIVHHATKLNSVVLIPDVRTSYQTENTIPIEYDLDKTSMLFIGGFHKSGQNLLRSILDAHPSINCAFETTIINSMLDHRKQQMRSSLEVLRLKDAGISSALFDKAYAEFILEMIVKQTKPVEKLCIVIEKFLHFSDFLSQSIPNAKYIMMVRDGRAVVSSNFEDHFENITNYDLMLPDFDKGMIQWNNLAGGFLEQCKKAGSAICMPVHYENLVLHPRQTLMKIMDFAEMPWNNNLMEHQNHINNDLSTSEEIKKPLNPYGLQKFVSKIPKDLIGKMTKYQMLKIMGYNMNITDGNYGIADSEVTISYNKWLNKTKNIETRTYNINH